MKMIKLAKLIFYMNILYWIVYNSIFGWNWTVQSIAEIYCDKIFMNMILIIIVFYLIPLMVIYENKVKENEKRNH